MNSVQSWHTGRTLSTAGDKRIIAGDGPDKGSRNKSAVAEAPGPEMQRCDMYHLHLHSTYIRVPALKTKYTMALSARVRADQACSSMRATTFMAVVAT